MGRSYLWDMLSASQCLQRIRDWQCTLPTRPGVTEPRGADDLVSHANCIHVFLIQGLSVVTFWMHLPRLCFAEACWHLCSTRLQTRLSGARRILSPENAADLAQEP